MARYAVLGAEAVRKKGWWRAHKWLLLRRLSQISVLLLFLLGPWAGLWILKGNLSSSLLLDSVPMTDPFIFLQMLAAGHLGVASEAVTGVLIVLSFYLLVGGRAYCSWVCPVNLVTDGAYWLRARLGLQAGARLGHNNKYWMLGMVMVVAAVTGSMAYELVNPVSMLHRGIIFGMGVGWLLIVGIFVFDLFVAKRGWCTHLCPMGAFYGLLGKFSPVRVRADERSRCDDCAECYAVCPESHIIAPVLKGADKGVAPVILSGECTNCGRCIDICGQEVFEFGWRNVKHGAAPGDVASAAQLKQQE